MSATTDSIQVNAASIREAVVASLNQGSGNQSELHQAAPVPTPEPAATAPVAAAPVEPAAAEGQPQTNLPVQADEEFVLDLSKNPLEEEAEPAAAAPVEEQSPEATMSRKQFDAEFNELAKKHPRFRQILAGNAEMSRIAAPPEEGGIGFRPEAEQVRQWHQSHSTMDQMMQDFTSGHPDAAKNFINFWMGRDASGATLRGVDTFVETLPVVLAESNPEAYQKIGTHFGSQLVANLTQMASSGSYNDEDRARLTDAANILARMTGIQPATNAQPQPQPRQNDEIAALQRRIAELEGRGQQQAQETIQQTVFSNFDAVLERDAEAALKPLKDAFATQPLVFQAIKDKMISELRDVAKQNPVIRAEISKSIANMKVTGQTNQMNQVIRLWRQGYADRLPQVRQNYLKAAGASITSKTDEARAVMQQAQNKTAPGPGTAPGQSMRFNSEIGINKGENQADAIKRVLSERLQGFRG